MTTSTPRSERKAETTAVILDAAEHVFIERGWHNTGIRDVADRAGLAPSSIYNHFGSKEQLFSATLARRALEVQEAAVTGFMRLRGFPGDLEGVVALMRQLAQDHGEFVRLAAIDISEFGAANVSRPDLDLIPVIEAIFRPYYDADAESGFLRGFDLRVVVQFVYLSLFTYFGLVQLYGDRFPNPTDPEHENREIARLLERGIVARPEEDQ
jgi:AcrR family transcriptional regulator